MLGKSSIIWSDKEQKEPISPHVISSFSSRFLLLVNRTLNWCLLNWMSGSTEDFVTMKACLFVCTCSSARARKYARSFKCGNMLSPGIKGSENITLLKYPRLRNFKSPALICNFTVQTQKPLLHWFSAAAESPLYWMAKPPEPLLFSHVTVAGLHSLSRKPQMSRKPLDISANHSSLNKHFLNDLREKGTGDRQATQPNKAPGPLTNLNPN